LPSKNARGRGGAQRSWRPRGERSLWYQVRRGWGRAGRLAVGLRGQGLLHGLLEQGLHVGGYAGRRQGGYRRLRWGSGRRFGRHALLAQGFELGLPLPRLVEEVLHPGDEVLHAVGQLGVTHIAHGVHDFELTDA